MSFCYKKKCSSKIRGLSSTKFYIWCIRKAIHSIFFFICATLIVPLWMPWFVDIDQGIHKGKTKVSQMKNKQKTTWVFFYKNYSKFWSILLKKFVEHKEEWKYLQLHVCKLFTEIPTTWRIWVEKWKKRRIMPLTPKLFVLVRNIPLNNRIYLPFISTTRYFYNFVLYTMNHD